MKVSFAPIGDERTRIVILGSFPGEISLARSQYYANPRNQFWRLIGSVASVQFPVGYNERVEVLLNAGIGLWDVVRSAHRSGSLDSAIRDHESNQLSAFIDAHPSLRALAFNGGKAAKLGRNQVAECERLRLVDLPSSSPAYTLSFERKAETWLHLRDFLSPG